MERAGEWGEERRVEVTNAAAQPALPGRTGVDGLVHAHHVQGSAIAAVEAHLHGEVGSPVEGGVRCDQLAAVVGAPVDGGREGG